MRKLPPWIRTRLGDNESSAFVHRTLAEKRLNTVCESALCPNKSECYRRGTATVMILGGICTRDCRFCAVPSGRPGAPDPDEPERVAELAAELHLSHVVVTSVTRDDLSDGGAEMFARTIACLKNISGVTVEVLTPDFQGAAESVAIVTAAEPDVFNHNLETVKRLQPFIRPQADYSRSLEILHAAARSSYGARVKSGIMVGLGETDAELAEALTDLFDAGCRYLTMGQYLSPSTDHAPVRRYVPPARFDEYRKQALCMGFKVVMAGPLVRSSYRAGTMLNGAKSPTGLQAGSER